MELTQRWIVFRLSPGLAGLSLAYSDSSAATRSPALAKDWPEIFLPGIDLPGGLRLRFPPDLDALLSRVLAPAAFDEPDTVPVFVEPPRGLELLPWELWLRDMFLGIPERDRLLVVRLAGRDWQPRPSFRLPLRVLAAGPEGDAALSALRERSWYTDFDFVREEGLRLETVPDRHLVSALKEMKPQVVVVTQRAVRRVLRASRRIALRSEEGPRLVVALGEAQALQGYALLSALPLPHGTSLVWAPLWSGADGAEYVRELLYGVFHDTPLHHAARMAYSHAGQDLSGPAFLAADPASVEGLRLREVLTATVEEAFEMDAWRLSRSPGAVLHHFGPEVPGKLRAALSVSSDLDGALEDAFQDAMSVQADFTQERRGLVGLSQARAKLRVAAQGEERMRRAFAEAARDPRTAEALAQAQERRVDVTLWRQERSQLKDLLVRPEQTLRPGARYGLRIQIGRLSPLSLVVGKVPPLDPLLPPLEHEKGHFLQVAVYGLDFTLASPLLRNISLPPLGASDKALFTVVAPERPGPARLRICVYYGLPPSATLLEIAEGERYNYLLQSFLLTTLVEPEERTAGPGEILTAVRLELSRTSRFSNLDEIRPRFISLGVNQGPDGSHTLHVKRGDGGGAIHFTDAVMQGALIRFRQSLEHATWNDRGDGPRFPHARAGTGGDFDAAIRSFARAGHELHDALWRRSRPLQPLLRDVIRTSDQILQIVRFDENYLFPWSILYDFAEPPDIVGAPEPEVCRGFTRVHADGRPFSCRECLDRCLHPDKSEAFCVYGFWGTRHQVEQVLHTPLQRQDAITRLSPIERGRVCVAVGLDQGIASNLFPELKARLGDGWARELVPGTDLLTELWSDGNRPAILLLLGHYETQMIPGQERGARISLPGQRWLLPGGILQKTKDLDRWKPPHPLVLLAACESAQADLSTLTGFLGAFADAGAAAVVGTEATVFEGLASRFGREITAVLLRDRTLGEAVLELRRQLLLEKNPLGFVFTPYGDAGLTVDWGLIQERPRS